MGSVDLAKDRKCSNGEELIVCHWEIEKPHGCYKESHFVTTSH